jgi:hypothetical protein
LRVGLPARYLWVMSDAARSALEGRPRFRPDPADEEDVRAAADDIAAGRGVTLTEAELLEWEASTTGDLPESVQARVDLLACPAPSR